jgi:hypothetical protein
MGRACKSIAEIACTRCTETIRMQNKEEMRVLVESYSMCRRQSAVAEMHRRIMVHRRDMAHRA